MADPATDHIAALPRARLVREALRAHEALLRYGQHTEDCPADEAADEAAGDCDCGLDAACFSPFVSPAGTTVVGRDAVVVRAIADALTYGEVLDSGDIALSFAALAYDAAVAAGMVPHRTSDEGTGYCPLAESAGREVERLRDGIRRLASPRCDCDMEGGHDYGCSSLETIVHVDDLRKLLREDDT